MSIVFPQMQLFSPVILIVSSINLTLGGNLAPAKYLSDFRNSLNLTDVFTPGLVNTHGLPRILHMHRV